MTQLRTELPQETQGPFVDSDFGDTVAVLIGIHSSSYSYSELKDNAERIETALRTLPASPKLSASAIKRNRSTSTSRSRSSRSLASIRSM